MRKLCVIGPYDRYNYGDLLFAYIIEYAFSDTYKSIEFYSTSKSTMSIYGGKDTLPTTEILKFDKNTYDIIVAGGESIGVTWGTLASFNNKLYSHLRKYILKIPHYNRYIDNYIGKILFKGYSYSPLLVTHKDFPNAKKIFYNSLGGGINSIHKDNKRFQIDIKNVNYISIRDTDSLNKFKPINKEVKLVPDTAVIMSEIFSKAYLSSQSSQKVNEFINSSKYFVFQINKSMGEKYLNECINLLNEICQQTKLKVALCTIGYAYLHEDFIPLRKIQKELKYPNMLFDHNNIWEIMNIISNSNFYIGTSLHGVITAMSFNKPYWGLLIHKIDTYLKDWGIKGLNKAFRINEVKDSILNIDFSSIEKELSANYNMQKELVIKSFNTMKQIAKK